jgi:histidyl-tRNA synthetase
MEKPTLPKGTRDFGPAQMAKRQFILNTIRQVFQKYGFQPLETPAMENLTTLTGKYGEEGDKLLFRITDSGEIAQKIREFANNVSVKVFGETSFFLLEILNEIAKSIDLANSNEVSHTEFIRAYVEVNLNLSEENDKVPQSIINAINEYLISDDPFSVLNRQGIIDAYKRKLQETGSAKLFEADLWPILPMFSQVVNSLIAKYSFESISNPKLIGLINEKGLRYDLTVPFARYVVTNRGEITFPFKRYQIQPVWRADRPQKGRYREFYQCDADVVGTDSLICEAEIVLMIKEVFKGLGIDDYSIKINHRGILTGISEILGAKGKESDLFVAIDKLDKIGKDKVREELITKGFSEESTNALFDILNPNRTFVKKIQDLNFTMSQSEIGTKGVEEIVEVLSILSDYGSNQDNIDFDISLARGLSYYTGCIFEVKINNVAIGSVSGGGRYDNLTGGFGLPGVSGVGFSFGVDRLYDAMEELKLFPQEAQISSKVLITHFDKESQRYGLTVLQTLRANGIASEIYPDSVKIQKQLDYANKKMIPFTIVIGSEEVKSGLLAFKNMKTGEQNKSSIDEILRTLKSAVSSKQ